MVGRELPVQRVAGKERRCIVEVLSPEVFNDVLLESFLVGDQFGIKEASALKGVFMEHSQTEPMDGTDGRLVKSPERNTEKPQGRVRIADLPEKALQEGVITAA